MKLLFLGTGAADRMNLEQDSDFSIKDHRRCSCAMLGDHVMIDCGPHALNSLKIAQIPLTNITDIIITHRHADHFNISAINEIAKNGGVRLWLRQGDVVECDAEVVYMDLFKAYNICEFTVTAVPANHEPASFPQHLCISDGAKKLFYALDGAWVLNETASFIKRAEFDAVVIDATIGDYSGDMRLGEHNSLPMIRLIIDSMRTLRIIREDTSVILSHIACCLHKSYVETCELVKDDGFTVAYDGLEIII
jgi:phosphoribosyl 1,2-cyclic phosphate phosphodiesterase